MEAGVSGIGLVRAPTSLPPNLNAVRVGKHKLKVEERRRAKPYSLAVRATASSAALWLKEQSASDLNVQQEPSLASLTQP